VGVTAASNRVYQARKIKRAFYFIGILKAVLLERVFSAPLLLEAAYNSHTTRHKLSIYHRCAAQGKRTSGKCSQQSLEIIYTIW